MNYRQMLSNLTRDEIEDLLAECCFYLEFDKVSAALLRGLTEEEVKLCVSTLSTHLLAKDDYEFDWPILKGDQSS